VQDGVPRFFYLKSHLVRPILSCGSFLHSFASIFAKAPACLAMIQALISISLQTSLQVHTACKFGLPRVLTRAEVADAQCNELGRTLLEARLAIDGVVSKGWRALAKDHLAAEVLKVGFHVQGHAHVVAEEVLCWHLQQGSR
jgi:hypothetical protein